MKDFAGAIAQRRHGPRVALVSRAGRDLYSLATRSDQQKSGVRCMKRWIGGLALVMLLTLAAGVWWQRAPLLAWYYVHRLAKSDDRERDTWAKRVVGLDRAALPHLFSCLEGDCAAACINVQTALTRLADRWGANDPRSAR